MDSDVQIGPYRILRRLSKGGMGSVYEALREPPDGPGSAAPGSAAPGSADDGPSRVAIKILSPEHAGSPEIIARFFNESRAVNRVGDPGLVRMFEDGQLPDGTAYIIMELLDGETLGQRVRRLGNRPPLASTLRLLQKVASTLANTHEKGIVHRDLKPDNIMIVDGEAPGEERTKVLDFGIAKLREPMQGPADMTRSDVLMGTPGYMSPEQCRGAGGVDEKTDVYSFGVMLFRSRAPSSIAQVRSPHPAESRERDRCMLSRLPRERPGRPGTTWRNSCRDDPGPRPVCPALSGFSASPGCWGLQAAAAGAPAPTAHPAEPLRARPEPWSAPPDRTPRWCWCCARSASRRAVRIGPRSRLL